MVSLHLILLITSKEKYNTQENSFSFTPFSKEDTLKAIKSLSSNKVSPMEDIPITHSYLLRKTY